MAKKTKKKGYNQPSKKRNTAKSRNPQPKKRTPTPSLERTPESYVSKLIFNGTTSENENLWRKIFYGVSGIALLVTIFLALGSGINGDDYFQNIYSDKILSFYGSMGKDTSTFEVPRGIIKIYGGLFELTTAVSNEALGLESNDEAYHDVRHVWNALFGFIAMLFTGLLAQRIAGWRAGVIALLFIFLTPRFLGHALMNPKDIPFATGYIMAIYFMLSFIKSLPKPSWKTIIGLTVGIGIAFGIRAGGLLLVAYLGLFVGLAYILKYGFAAIWEKIDTTLRVIGWSLIPAVGGLVLGTLFWPYGLVDPIEHIPEALSGFSKFSVGIKMLFNGEMILGNNAPVSYLPTWFLKTLPLFIFVGIILTGVFIKKILNNYTPFYLFMVLFAFVFPIVFVISQGSTLYDGWRHMLFTYPSLVVLCAVGWEALLKNFEEKQNFKTIIFAAMGLLLLESTIYIIQNPKYPYTYFNSLAGGISNAYGNYETDYWGVSLKQGLDWLEQEGLIGENSSDTVKIVSNFSDALNKYANKKYKGKVRTGYVRFRQRYDQDWDYGLFSSRFVSGSYIKNGTWPPKDATIHTIDANGVPLLAVVKNENPKIAQGVKAIKAKDWARAIELLEAAKQLEPNNEIIHTELARAYIQVGELPKAESAAMTALSIEPENLQSTNLLALCYLRTNKIPEAEALLKKSIVFEPKNAVGFYYLALIEQGRKNLASALELALKSVQVKKDFKEGYQLFAQIYQQIPEGERSALKVADIVRSYQELTGGK